MKRKKIMALLLVSSITATMGNEILFVNAQASEMEITESNLLDATPSQVPQEGDEPEDEEETGDSREEETGDSKEEETPEAPQELIKNLKATYDDKTNLVTLNWETATEGDLGVKAQIYVNEVLQEDECDRNSYAFEAGVEGITYQIEVIPYKNIEKKGVPLKVSVEVGYHTAILEGVDADYTLENKKLEISWEGSYISMVDIYEDDQLLVSQVKGEKYVVERELAPLSKHVYKVVPYNAINESSTEKTVELDVADLDAKIEEVEAVYDVKTGIMKITWSGSNIAYGVVSINDLQIDGEYKNGVCQVKVPVQSGATYRIDVTPVNKNESEGDLASTVYSLGELDAPIMPTVKETSVPATDSKGNFTGLYKPAAMITIHGEANATYEIYYAKSDSKRAYSYIGTVKTKEAGIYTYTDTKCGTGFCYYALRKVIKEDDYVQSELSSAMSEADCVEVTIPRAQVSASVARENQITLKMSCNKDIVSGYQIYRRKGKEAYKKIATVSGNTYTDKKLEPSAEYTYKVRAYYYDTKQKTMTYGDMSKTVNIINEMGDIKVTAKILDKNNAQISWNKVAYAKKYEVYYKTGVTGDSYKLLKKTDKTTLSVKVTSGSTYHYMVKACGKLDSVTKFTQGEVVLETGFVAPTEVKISNTTYKLNKNVLTQKDTISWQKVYGADGYYIEQFNPVTKKFAPIKNIKKYNENSFTVENTVSDKIVQQSYRVSAYQNGNILIGDTVNVDVKLSNVKDIKVELSGSKANLSWSKVVAAESYNIYRSNGRTKALVGTTKKNSYTDKGLATGITYIYYIQPVNKTLKFASSMSKSEKVRITLNKPKNLKVKQVSNSRVEITWSKVSNASGYVVYCKKQGGTYYKLATCKASKNSFTQKYVTVGKKYSYKVVATYDNIGGETVEGKSSDVKKLTIKKMNVTTAKK